MNAQKMSSPKNTCTVSFAQALLDAGVVLERDITRTLQVNLGLKCNQMCVHCHLDAGPARNEWMTRQTMDQVVGFAEKGGFNTVDITGGAPELHDRLIDFVKDISGIKAGIILRSNLSVLNTKEDAYLEKLKDNQVGIVASFPSLNEVQADAMRGRGVFATSIDCLRKLNKKGYGAANSGLTLDLVVNPSGAFLPPSQEGLEKRFKKMLAKKWGISFDRVFSFANVPLGRFYTWLKKTGNYDAYVKKLASAFNPATIQGLMCRSLVSVAWDGYLYDCDFNQAAGIPLGREKKHITEVSRVPDPGTPIAVGGHCFTCTAGSGFT